MGWAVPELSGIHLVIAPSATQISELIDTTADAVHIMGGIRVGAMIARAFDLCSRKGCKVGIMTEPYNAAGWKGVLRSIKFRYGGLHYFKHIDFVLAIGKQAERQYQRAGFPGNRLFPWAYFITVAKEARPAEANEAIRILYAGRLEAAKGILRFVETLLSNNAQNYVVNLYGEGEDEQALRALIDRKKAGERISIQPFQPHAAILRAYAYHDWVVLPSAAKDGWGAIVSEGLLNGTKAICSSICGASRVITPGRNGVIFDWSATGDCERAVNSMLNNTGYASPAAIATWADNGISAEAGATYLLQITDHLYRQASRPGLPWEKPISE